jgi:hypothetical protein
MAGFSSTGGDENKPSEGNFQCSAGKSFRFTVRNGSNPKTPSKRVALMSS